MKLKIFNTLSVLVAICLFAILTGCGSGGSSNQVANGAESQQQTGKIAVKLNWDSSAKITAKAVASMPVSVTIVRVIISAADISPSKQFDFPASNGSGTIDGVKVGTGRLLTVQGLNASGTVKYHGRATNISIQAGQTSDVGTITMAANTVPVANAGMAQNVTVGSLVTLDGSASSDANNDALTFIWAFTSKPNGSSASMSSTTVSKPTFTPDVAGAYVLSLIVKDGKEDSVAATVTITAAVANSAPVANAGTAQSVASGDIVTLDGSGSSDANGDSLTYSWSFTSKPNGSSVSLSNTIVSKPAFTPDVAGAYVLSLIVNDGKVNSSASSVNITAISNTGSITIKW